METPLRIPAELKRAWAAYARARLALDLSRYPLEQDASPAIARRHAEAWSQVGETALKVAEVMEQWIDERDRDDAEERAA